MVSIFERSRAIVVPMIACLIAGCSAGSTVGAPAAPAPSTSSPASGSTPVPQASPAASGTPSPAPSGSPSPVPSAPASAGPSAPSQTASPTPIPGVSASPVGVQPTATPKTPAPVATPTPIPTASSAPAAGIYAPLDRAGPALDVTAATLAASITCSPLSGTSSLRTVLLVPGTTLTPSVNYAWNYERAFTANGTPWCAVTLPDNAMADIPTAGEYLVNAIRTIAHRTGRSIDILGFSQGGMVPRWALRFWPDTRALVDSFVALDPSNHGTADAYPVCLAGCAPAFWQQQSGSNFIAALNSGAETFAGISYTVVYSDTDEVVVPNLPIASSSSLSTGNGSIANISVQSICPADVSEHLAMGSYDPVGYALAVDAFAHGTIAKTSDVPSTVCSTLFQPGVDPTAFAGNYATYAAYVAGVIASTPFVPAEPALPSYVYATP